MKTFTGKVVSTNMQKTVVVERVITRAHPIYKKIVRKHKRLKAHNELSLAVGDSVRVIAIKPMSKEKHYQVVEKISRSV